MNNSFVSEQQLEVRWSRPRTFWWSTIIARSVTCWRNISPGTTSAVSAAENAARARRLLEASAIDLVVLDIMMPGEDGLSLCRHLRATSDRCR